MSMTDAEIMKLAELIRARDQAKHRIDQFKASRPMIVWVASYDREGSNDAMEATPEIITIMVNLFETRAQEAQQAVDIFRDALTGKH